LGIGPHAILVVNFIARQHSGVVPSAIPLSSLLPLKRLATKSRDFRHIIAQRPSQFLMPNIDGISTSSGVLNGRGVVIMRFCVTMRYGIVYGRVYGQ